MLTLIGECKTTEQIVYEVGESPDEIIPNLIRLRHLGIVEPIAIKSGGDGLYPDRVDYIDNLLWSLTEHGQRHDAFVEGCYGCRIREKLMLDVAGLVE